MAMKERVLYKGICVGGPMDGQDGVSRFPEGFLLVDPRPDKQRVWVYDYREGTDDNSARLADRSRFIAREGDALDEERAERTANEPRYDVRAFDPEVMG